MPSDRATPAELGEAVLGYCRVSTETQGDDGYSLDDQGRKLRDYAVRHGLILDNEDVFVEEFSGARVHRPQMDRLLVRAKRSPGRYRFILVAVADRAERFDKEFDRAYFRHMVRQAGLSFVDISRPYSAADDLRSQATKDLYDDIITAFAGYERQLILARTQMGREARAREDGLHWGGRRPFGMRFAPVQRRGKQIANGRLVEDKDEGVLVRLIYRLFLDGETIVGIARYLNRQYPHLYPTGSAKRQAGRWSARAVRVVLTNPIYAGRLVLNRTYGEIPKLPQNPYRRTLNTSRKVRPRDQWIEVPAAADELIDKETWTKAQEKLLETRRAKVRATNAYVLRGLLFHECGRAGTGHSRQAAPKTPVTANRDGRQPIGSTTTDEFGIPRGPRDLMPLFDSEDRLRSLAVDPTEGNRSPWGYYDPHRYYACVNHGSLVSAFKVENAIWFWICLQLTDPAVLDELARHARQRDTLEADAAPRLRRRINSLLKDRADLLKQQEAARAKVGQPGWSIDQVDQAIGRLAQLVLERETEIEAIRHDLRELEETGPLNLPEQERAEVSNFVSQFQWGYFSPRLWHLMLSYFVAKVEWGRTKGRRNRGWLRIHTTGRLGSRVETIPLPMRVETLIRQVERAEGSFPPFRWIMPGSTTNSTDGEARDADAMIRLFGPPSGYSPYMLTASVPDGLDRFSAMWQEIAQGLMAEPSSVEG